MATTFDPSADTKFEHQCYTPNGRDIRLNTETGKFEVQPWNDNYWLEFDTLEQAYCGYHPDWDGENHE
jgi:hypothetical protein